MLTKLILIIPCFQLVYSITQCYKCTFTPPSQYSNETTRLCSDFDYSDKFIVDCPFSTLCMKRSFSAKIPAPINATERDCAKQKYVTQNFKDGKWQPEFFIEEPYKEECSIIDDKGFRTSNTEFCYCRGNLCNFSIANIYSIYLILSTVIINSLIYLNI